MKFFCLSPGSVRCFRGWWSPLGLDTKMAWWWQSKGDSGCMVEEVGLDVWMVQVAEWCWGWGYLVCWNWWVGLLIGKICRWTGGSGWESGWPGGRLQQELLGCSWCDGCGQSGIMRQWWCRWDRQRCPSSEEVPRSEVVRWRQGQLVEASWWWWLRSGSFLFWLKGLRLAATEFDQKLFLCHESKPKVGPINHEGKDFKWGNIFCGRAHSSPISMVCVWECVYVCVCVCECVKSACEWKVCVSE